MIGAAPQHPIVRFPRPHPGQRFALENARRFNWLICGRRWRKTTLAMRLGVRAALDGKTVVWGAPTLDQCMTGFEETKTAAYDVARFKTSPHIEARFGRTGGRILWRSMDDPDNARSKTAHRIILDEVPLVHPDAWYKILRPMLIDTDGDFWGLGTPQGHNWAYDEVEKAKLKPDTHAVFNAPTLGCRIDGMSLVREPHPLENPFIPFSELEEIWQNETPERTFREEYLAEFIQDGSGVLRNIDALAIHRALDGPIEGHTLFLGIDWGEVEDYTVFTLYDATTKRVVYMDRFRGLEYPIVELRLVELLRKWRPAGIVAEENSIGRPLIQHLRRRGIRITPFIATNASNNEAVDILMLALERKDLGLLDDPIHKAEMKAYRSEILPSGRRRYGAPTGKHDDTVDSLMFALWGAQRVTKPLTDSQRQRMAGAAS